MYTQENIFILNSTRLHFSPIKTAKNPPERFWFHRKAISFSYSLQKGEYNVTCVRIINLIFPAKYFAFLRKKGGEIVLALSCVLAKFVENFLHFYFAGKRGFVVIPRIRIFLSSWLIPILEGESRYATMVFPDLTYQFFSTLHLAKKSKWWKYSAVFFLSSFL